MRRPRPGALALLALLPTLALTMPSPARALDGAAAARSFQAGKQAYAHGDFRAAAAAFDQAYELAPRGAAAYNGGRAWEAADEAAFAADDYTRALRAGDLDTVQRADAMGRLKALEARVGRLSVLAADDAEITVDGDDVTDRAKDLHLMPGVHSIRVQLDGGRVETRSVRIGAGEQVEARFERAVAPEPPTDSTASSSSASRDAKTRADDASSGGSTWRVLSYVALGGAVAASGIALATYETGLSADNRFMNDRSDGALRAQAESLRTATWVAWSFAGALAATGVVLFFTSPSAPDGSVTAHPAALEVLPAGLRLRVGF
jgi:tetratricopeptide (TPR) repeat protein